MGGGCQETVDNDGVSAVERVTVGFHNYFRRFKCALRIRWKIIRGQKIYLLTVNN